MPTRPGSAKKPAKDVAASYEKAKEHGGRRYVGMKIGGHHTWKYDEGTWKETKVTPDRWEFRYEVPKRRRGKAPEGSGAPVGTEYHWYIVAHQFVKKLDANTYSTRMEGLKHKVAHKRAKSEEWSPKTEQAQRKRLLAFLEEAADDVRREIEGEARAGRSGRKAGAAKARAEAPESQRRLPLGETAGEEA